MTVSIHASSGWALVISLHQSTALPTQPWRQGGGNRQLSLLLSVTLSPSFPAHLCLSLSLKLSFCEGCVSSLCPHTTCDFQPCLPSSPPLCVFQPRRREMSEPHPSLSSVCKQTRPRRWSVDASCPERPSGCQFPPKSRQSALSHLLKCQPTLPSWLPGLCFSLTIYCICK